MPDSPPVEPSPPPPSPPPKELEELEAPNPNPNFINPETSNPLSSNSETQNPPPEQTQPEQEFKVTVKDQDQDQDQEQEQEQEQHDDPEPEPEPENLEPGGMDIPLSPISNPSETHNLIGHENQPFKVSSARRTSKRKKSTNNRKTIAAVERKMQQLSQGFKPIPFIPDKSIDFAKHEVLLKKLGLWDFAHVEFDRNIRVDLVMKLIADYNVSKRGSHVNGLKIGVSRADLVRALKLPKLKKIECDVETFPADFLTFLDEFVSKWMLLHEDPWCTPIDIVNWMKLIKEGNPHKVDWAGMIWYMMEKELGQNKGLKECYYASHFQLLIKAQKEDLFRENLNLEVGIPKVGLDSLKDTVAAEDDEEEVEDGGDVKMTDVEESGSVGEKLEEQNIELSLGHDSVAEVENVGDAEKVEKDGECHTDDDGEKVEDADEEKEEHDIQNSEDVDEGMKVESIETAEPVENIDNAENPEEESKDEEMLDLGDYKEEHGQEEEQGQGQWFLDSDIGGKPFLQRCSMTEMNVSEDTRLEDVVEDVEDDEAEDGGHVEGFKIMQKDPLDAMTSANLMQAFETGQLPFPSNELGGQSSLDLMTSRADKNMMLGGPSMFNQSGKREIDHELDLSHQALNDNHKRMRVDGDWDNKPPNFDMCMGHIQQWVEKAKLCHITATDEAYQLSQNFFAEQLLQKDNEIAHLRYKYEELSRKKQVEVDHLNRELFLMNSVIEGYRKALKQTQRTFLEYRKRCQVPDEPIYKDAGLGGVVKSVMELERERLKEEEENRRMRYFIEDMFKKFQNEIEDKWADEILAKLHYQHSRLVYVGKEMELFKDYYIKQKKPANIQKEPEVPSE